MLLFPEWIDEPRSFREPPTWLPIDNFEVTWIVTKCIWPAIHLTSIFSIMAESRTSWDRQGHRDFWEYATSNSSMLVKGRYRGSASGIIGLMQNNGNLRRS